MNKLVWKLLRQHISIGQLSGFFLANIFGMLIVLLSVQFYKDVLMFHAGRQFYEEADHIIATKKRLQHSWQHYLDKAILFPKMKSKTWKHSTKYLIAYTHFFVFYFTVFPFYRK